MNPNMSEHQILRTYLEWLIDLPWNNASTDRLDIKIAKQTLDNDHFGLDKIKTRIIEYLSIRKLKKDLKGPILCFLGPPGTGKTSLGKSIANSLGRKVLIYLTKVL
jgi:ATP-dependent Lon protease